MNILLLIPPASLDLSYGQLKDFSNPQPSVGLAYIASILRDNGYNVSILDAYVSQLGAGEILDEVASRNVDLIGISVLTTSVDVVTELIKRIRKQLPQLKIVLGNMHASLFCDEILNDHLADFIIHREGEYAMLELVKALENGDDPQSVKGISFRDDGHIIHTPVRPFITELDKLPFPAWDLFPLDSYHTDPRTEVISGKTERLILATRGCPNACTFCSSRTERSMGSKYRMRSPVNIVDEMEYMHERYKSEVFSFMDMAFPLKKAHAMAVFQEMIDRGINKKVVWCTECRVKPIDHEIFKAMREAGCVRINFGIESGSNRILKALKKGFTLDDVRRAVGMARKVGIEVDGMFMMGLPTETDQEIRATIDFAIELNVRYAIFNIFVPYPGCELYDMLSAQDKVSFKSWSEFTSYPTYTSRKPIYVPDGLTHSQIMNLQKYAMRKFYLRPRFVCQEFKRFKPSKIKEYYHGLKGLLF